MQKTTAISKTPSPQGTSSPKPITDKVDTKSQPNRGPSAVFVSMALDMSWRLAIVVLLPLVGGAIIDSKLGTSPVLTLIGFVLALIGMYFTVKQTVKAASEVQS